MALESAYILYLLQSLYNKFLDLYNKMCPSVNPKAIVVKSLEISNEMCFLRGLPIFSIKIFFKGSLIILM